MTTVENPLAGDNGLNHRLTETAQQALSGAAIPGASVAIMIDGAPAFVLGVGFRDLEQTASLDANARFYIYSVTKSLIAAVILQLVEQGTVALDRPFQEYLPQIPFDTPVSLCQLLNHTGGIPNYGGLPAYFEAIKADPKHAWTSAEFLAASLPKGLDFPPGQGWAYSNIGFLLLRMVIEAVLQTSLRTALHERIFKPLGLQHICVAETLEDARQLTPGYSTFFVPGGPLHDIRLLYHPGWVSHGVVISTALDLACVYDALFTGRMINAQSLAVMFEAVDVHQKHPFFRRPAYGLGLMIDPESRFGVIAGHGGGGPGYSIGALQIPDVHGRRITSVAMTNSDQGDDIGLTLAFNLAMLVGDTL